MSRYISRFFLISYYFESSRGRAYFPEFVGSDEMLGERKIVVVRIYLKKKEASIDSKILFLSSFELVIRKNIDFRLIHFLTRIFYFFIFAFSRVSSNYVSIYLYYFFLCNTIILLHFVQQSMQQKYMKLEEILLLEYI